jgi:hypothetical protein
VPSEPGPAAVNGIDDTSDIDDLSRLLQTHDDRALQLNMLEAGTW